MNRCLAVLFLAVGCAGSPVKFERCDADTLRDSVPPLVMQIVEEKPIDWSSVSTCVAQEAIVEIRKERPLGGRVSLPDRAVEYRVAQIKTAAGLN